VRIQELDRVFRGNDVYVVGTGPSARFFPWKFLADKVVIGLNQAFRYAPMTVSITVHPELVLEYGALEKKHQTVWAVKKKPPLDKLDLDDRRHYVFHTAEDWELFERPRKDTLFIGRGVQQTAMDLASRMGARSIVLVGVDMAALGGDHHAHDQHVRFHGLPPRDVYLEYRRWTAKARRLIREHRGVPTLSMSPLIGADQAEDYARLVAEYGLPPLPTPTDTSKYKRERADL
jgi:hypothetical protein